MKIHYKLCAYLFNVGAAHCERAYTKAKAQISVSRVECKTSVSQMVVFPQT